ncbi:MAG: VWA domain-containing protein, partial [Candidatus Pacebacteria bacterium]|nr:VWA domain-containing protein [Candidatus Paceibacterota bacterium]
MKLKTKNIRSILFKKNSYLILFIFSFMFFDSNTPLAQALSCKGPADVVLVIDRSANMAGGSKFDTVKNSSVNFIDKLFDPDRKPNSSFIPYDYHQIGLSIFNNNITSENLSTDDSYIKDIISNLGAPDSSCKAGLAVQKAQANLNANGNSKATKTIIILISGPPDDLAFAIEQVRIAKESGTRIISVGINLDELTGQQRIDAENFISNEHIFSYDCYYASDNPSATLDGCTPILYDNLNDSLNKVYDDITEAVCDEFAPVLSISRQPGGTLYDIDKLTITSIANDDVGFKSHSIVWSDNWPDDQIEKNDCSLIGKIISCDTEELEPFAIGETINFGSSVTDANDNIVTIDPLGNIAKVAAVSLDFEALFRNKNNEINVQISDYTGPDEFFIRVDNGGLTRVINEEDESSKMTCSGAGSVRDCVFYFNPSCASEGVYTDPGNAVDIYIDVESIGITRSEYISSKLDEPLGLLSEGAAWGNCSDGIDNDCDGIVDSGEMLCDVGGPSVGILRNPSGDIYDFEEDEVTPMPITFESTAGDSNGIKQHAIYHRENGGDWQIFDCNDADPGDGKIICDGIEISQNIATVSTTIDSFTAGTLVEYYSVAVDYSGNDNSTNSATESFIVRNRSCFGIDNLEDCRGMLGKCCGEVCNAVISNPKNYNTNCAQEICGDALKYEEDVRVVREDGRAISFDGINDYVNIPSVNPTEAITVSAWVKSATDTGYSGYWQIVSKYSAYLLGTSWSGGKQMCFIIYSGGWNYGSCYTVPDPYPQEWHHFAGTYDKQTGEKKLYVDGILRDTTNFVGSINPDEGPMHIGHREGSASDYFNGFVDEIYIYGRALDLGEIENLRDGISVSSADLAGYWSFDEEFGDVVYDYSGNGNPGTLMNFPIPVVEPGILWQWTVDGGKNGASCDIKSDSDGCYALMTNGGCEERLYSCSAGYCNYNSDKDKDHCEGEILYNFGCSGSFCELNPNPPVEDPVCDVTFGSLFLDAYDSDYESEGESAFISGSHGTETGEVLDNMTNTVLLKSIANDTSGISEQIIYWKKEGDADFTVKDDCVVPCGGGVDCICEESIIGPFDIGDVIKFYATSKDNSPNKTGETTITYSFTVFDNQCYDIDNNENKSDLTSCEAGTGKCCGGICDTSVEDPFSYHDDCRKDSCSLTSWVYGQDNGGGSCGSTDSCLDHYSLNNGFYSGCITGGNKCSFGYCDTSLSLISAPSCDGNLLTNYSCDPDNETGTCQPKDSDIDCSSAGVYDGDTVACNCDCDNYDIEEKVYSSLSFDGVDDHVEIPDDSSLNISDEISVEVWVKDVVGTGSSQDDG